MIIPIPQIYVQLSEDLPAPQWAGGRGVGMKIASHQENQASA